jgi:hypothetical protein
MMMHQKFFRPDNISGAGRGAVREAREAGPSAVPTRMAGIYQNGTCLCRNRPDRMLTRNEQTPGGPWCRGDWQTGPVPEDEKQTAIS